MQQALGYFRRQTLLQQDERDAAKGHIARVEEEVASLQRRIQELEAANAALTKDKATLAEANRKVLAQLNTMFEYGQAVQSGLAFKGLAPEATPNTTTS